MQGLSQFKVARFCTGLISQVIVIVLIDVNDGGVELLGVREVRLGCIDNVKLSAGMSNQMTIKIRRR